MKLLDVNEVRNKKIAVISAHSDDAEMLAGGTLVKLGKEELGNELVGVVVTDGRMGAHGWDVDYEDYVRTRMEESKEAVKFYNASVSFWSYPDLHLESRKKHLVRRLVKFFLKERVDIVMSFDPWGKYEAYVHPDHRTLAWAIQEALLNGTLPKWVVKNKFGKRRITKNPEKWLWAPGEANIGIDVSDVWEKRVDMVSVFKSQFDQEGQEEKMKGFLESRSREIGEMIGVERGELFRFM